MLIDIGDMESSFLCCMVAERIAKDEPTLRVGRVQHVVSSRSQAAEDGVVFGDPLNTLSKS